MRGLLLINRSGFASMAPPGSPILVQMTSWINSSDGTCGGEGMLTVNLLENWVVCVLDSVMEGRMEGSRLVEELFKGLAKPTNLQLQLHFTECHQEWWVYSSVVS